MSKHYNLTVTDDNGKSVTTSNTSTEHAEEILRMMQLAGMQSQDCGCGASPCGCDESIEENEYKPTPANDKLDLDDYSKKSGESIPKQKKSLDKAPSRGDNPLEYSLDENEIFESLMNEFETVEEGKLPPGLQAYQDKKKSKKDDKEDKVEEKKAKPDFADIDGDGDKKETMKKAAKDKKEKADESINEAKCDCDCGKDPCEECGKSHHKVNESELEGEFKSPEGGPLSYKRVGEYTYIVKDENGEEHKAEVGAMGDEQDNYSGDEIEQTMDQEGLEMLVRQAKMGAPTNESEPMGESTDNEFACINTDTGAFGYCGKDELHKFTHMMPASEFTYFEPQDNNFQGMDDEMADQEGWSKIKKEESPELARLRKLAGTEKVDELAPLAVLAPVAKAVGGALLKKGIKGMAARAGASAVASKALSNKNPQ